MATQNSISECGARIEMISLSKWRMEGPRAIAEITMNDNGGWDIKIDEKENHANTLMIAMSRSYRLVLGLDVN